MELMIQLKRLNSCASNRCLSVDVHNPLRPIENDLTTLESVD